MRTSPLLLVLASSLVACGMHASDLGGDAPLSEPPPPEAGQSMPDDDGAARSQALTAAESTAAAQPEAASADPSPTVARPREAPARQVPSTDRTAKADDSLADLAEDEESDVDYAVGALGGSAGRGDLAASSPAGGPRLAANKAKDSDERKKSERTASTGAPATMPVTTGDRFASAPPPPPSRDTVSTSESYKHYGVNPMTLATRDNLSTFSIDVDTASYSIARRKLQSGQLPPTGSVRVEEFVNAQDYGYTAPGGDAPFAVYLEAAPNPFLPGHHVLRVGVKGRELDDDSRNPVHLTFLVDVSGSMSSADKLGLAKQSLHELVENLQPQDTVALATYAGHVARVLEPMKVSSRNAETIHRAIDDLASGGGTGMSSGVDLAYQLASDGFVKGHENRVIVMSDGDANIGPASHTAILEQIRGHAERGITLSTIGFGMGNYKDVMMEQLANQGDGNYFYIDSQAEAQEVFGEDLSGTLQVIAKDVKIQVEFNTDAVNSYRLIGYENRDIADRDFRNDRVDAGEIGAGHSVTALYDVVLADSGASELATVRLRNKTPGADSAAVEWSTAFPSELLHTSFTGARDDFQLAYGAATFAELLRGSPYGAEVTYSELYELVSLASRQGNAEDAELLALIATAGQLSGERGPVAWR